MALEDLIFCWKNCAVSTWNELLAYMVLCGSSIGPYCAENQAFVLEGFPDELLVTDEYRIKTRLYKIDEKNLNISVPYPYKTQYELWLSYEEPTKYGKATALTKLYIYKQASNFTIILFYRWTKNNELVRAKAYKSP